MLYITIMFIVGRCNALEKERNIMMFSRRSEFRKENCSLEESEMKSMNERKTESEYKHISLVNSNPS